MPTPMLANQYGQLTNLSIALRAVFNDQIGIMNGRIAGDSVMSLFNVQTSTNSQERNQGVGGFGNVPEYNGTITYDSLELLYPANYLHKEYVMGMAVERKLIDDDQYGVMRQRASLMGLSFDRTMETHGAGIFNNAFSALMPGPDGKPLVATDHVFGSTTQSNKGTAALSQQALIDAEAALMGFRDSRGNPSMVVPDTILVPLALKSKAEAIVGSALRSDTNTNEINVLSGYRVVVSRYLTDSNNWFLLDSRMAKMYLNWYWRVRPEFADDPTSDYNLVLRYRGYMRYAFGYDHWGWVYGSEVAGA